LKHTELQKQSNKMKILLISLFLLTAILGVGFIFNTTQKQKDWPVPDADKNKVNPIAADVSSIADGKALWGTHCQSCHGKKGLGDGPKSDNLKTEAGDFSKNATQGQTDGSLYFKIVKGRDDMPGYKKKIPESDDIWSLVNYMRTFKK
jgi:mono/diheme cytochrome c family protein